MTSLGAFLRDAAAVHGDRPFLLLEDEEVTFAELDRRAEEEDGELQVRGRSVAGYWNAPEATGETFSGGRLATGDMVARRPDGHLVLRGRRKEMFLQGGFNVYPVEGENVLAAHPGVAVAAGIGVPDDVLGEVGLYVVVPRDPAGPPSEGELLTWCRERLADYKVPHRIELRAQLPTTPAGKVAEARLRQDLGIG